MCSSPADIVPKHGGSGCPSSDVIDVGDRRLFIDRMQIQISVEAEVKTIPLKALPPSFIKRMGLSFRSVQDQTGDPDPIVLCISPVRAMEAEEFGKQSQAVDKNAAGCGLEGDCKRSTCLLPVKTSNLMAFKVLKNLYDNQSSDAIDPLKEILKSCGAACVPQGKTFRFKQDALIIHNRKVYLFINKAKGVQEKLQLRNPSQAGPMPSCAPESTHPVTAQKSLSVSPTSETQPGPVCTTPQSCSGSPKQGLSSVSSAPVKEHAKPFDIRVLKKRFGVSQELQVTVARLPNKNLGGPIKEQSTSSDAGKGGVQQCELLDLCHVESQSPDAEEPTATEALEADEVEQSAVEDAAEQASSEDLDDEPPSKKSKLDSEGQETCFPDPEPREAGALLAEQAGGDGVQESEVGLDFSLSDLGFTTVFDFDQSVRDEKISRIKALLKEKEAALNRLKKPDSLP
nr:PREDICTED: uncharacterized protein LOC107076838 [Lepisosteus oculatus]XP_015198021.1 PREDICTED: uncharacterized protein LOC107076838 [Lepisosteus oculatus]